MNWRCSIKVQAQLKNLASPQNQAPVIPSESQIRQRIADLQKVFCEAIGSTDRRVIDTVRHVLGLVTGGKIILSQRGERRHHRGWLQATFEVDLSKAFHIPTAAQTTPLTISIDMKPQEPVIDMTLARQCKEMYDQGMMTKLIAKKVGTHRNKVHALLRAAFEEVGGTLPRGKNPVADRRVNLQSPLQHQALSEKVKSMADEGMQLQEIAAQLATNRDVVTKALRYWYENRGQIYVDGRARRKQLRLLRQGQAA